MTSTTITSRKSMRERAKLLYTDTDSFFYQIEPEEDDFYKEISKDVEAKFDTSNYTERHPLYLTKNNKQISFFKDECARSKLCIEFVGLRAKLVLLQNV